MNNDDRFTLLSKNKIKKDYILDSKYKIGIPTDYAKFLGVVENDDKCCYWTCSSKNNIPYYVDENGKLKKFKLELNTNSKIAIRPVLSYSDLKYITPKGVVTHDEHFTLIIEYGWYPQDAVPEEVSKKLELLFNQRKIESASNSYYHYTGPKQLEVSPEYEFDGRYYIRMYKSINPYEVGWYKWFEVKPVKWIVDEDNKFLISQKCLTSGTPYLHPDKNYYDGDFKKTDIYNFLNCYFKNNLLQRHNPLLLGNQTLFGNYYYQDEGEPLKFIKDYMYASNNFEKGKGLTDDISTVHSIGNSAFETCNLEELELPLSVHNIGYKAFYHCYNLNLVLPSSLVYLNFCGSDESITNMNCFNFTFSSCKSLKIYGNMFFLINFECYTRFKKIQYEELNDLIEYILSNYNIKNSESVKTFFDDKCREIILQVNKEADFNEIPKWKEMLIEYIIKYLYKRKPYLKLKKQNVLRNDIINIINAFYIEKNLINKTGNIKKEIIKEASESTKNIPLQIMNNAFESKSEDEVLELITNLKISKPNNIDIKTLHNYGEKLKPFLDYISNYFSKIIFENNINENRTMNIKHELGNYNGKIEAIDNSFLGKLNEFISDAITKLEDKENKLDTLKRIMHAYILKLEEIYKELNNSLISFKSNNLKEASDNYLINNIIENKKTALEKNIETILQEYMQLSIMLVNEDNFLNNLIIIRDNLLPKLVLAISLTSDSINKRKQASVIKEIYNLLDDKKDRKRKINLLHGVKEKLNTSILESKSSNKDEVASQTILGKLYDSNDTISKSTKYMHLVNYMDTSDIDENIHRKGK